MIVDLLKNIDKYSQFDKYKKIIHKFAKAVHEESVDDGKYELDGDGFYASVQTYHAKSEEDCYPESHKKYQDLQYLVSGREWIYYSQKKDLTVKEDRLEQDDLLFYHQGMDSSKLLLEDGVFVYFDIDEVHTPCIAVRGHEKELVKKIVFKIRKQEED